MGKRNLEAEIDDLREEVSMLNTMIDNLSDVVPRKALSLRQTGERRLKKI